MTSVELIPQGLVMVVGFHFFTFFRVQNIVASSLMSHLATLPSDVALQALAEVKGYKGSANPGKLVVFTADQILHQRKEGLYPSAQGHMHAWRMLFFCMGEVCSSSSAHMQNV